MTVYSTPVSLTKETCGLNSNYNDFKYLISYLLFYSVPFSFFAPIYVRLHVHLSALLLSTSVPSLQRNEVDAQEAPSLARLHWPHADDRRGSVAPWGLIMDNPSCFTIHKLRLLRFKHVFTPIPCSFLFLLLFFWTLLVRECKCCRSIPGIVISFLCLYLQPSRAEWPGFSSGRVQSAEMKVVINKCVTITI